MPIGIEYLEPHIFDTAELYFRRQLAGGRQLKSHTITENFSHVFD